MTGVVLTVGGIAMLGIAAVLSVIRIAKGPSTLDRVAGSDVLVAVMITGMAIVAAVTRTGYALPVILVLALLGFATSLATARLVSARDRADPWADVDSSAGRALDDPGPPGHLGEMNAGRPR
ncbi:monovalent cation/H+ antiporter complex subunit F [Nakamurella aerolata]